MRPRRFRPLSSPIGSNFAGDTCSGTSVYQAAHMDIRTSRSTLQKDEAKPPHRRLVPCQLGNMGAASGIRHTVHTFEYHRPPFRMQIWMNWGTSRQALGLLSAAFSYPFPPHLRMPIMSLARAVPRQLPASLGFSLVTGVATN